MYTSDDITKQISTGEFRAVVRHSNATNAVVKTTIRLRFDCYSTALSTIRWHILTLLPFLFGNKIIFSNFQLQNDVKLWNDVKSSGEIWCMFMTRSLWDAKLLPKFSYFKRAVAFVRNSAVDIYCVISSPEM